MKFAFKSELLETGWPFETKLIEVRDFADGKVCRIAADWFEAPAGARS